MKAFTRYIVSVVLVSVIMHIALKIHIIYSLVFHGISFSLFLTLLSLFRAIRMKNATKKAITEYMERIEQFKARDPPLMMLQ